MKTDPPSNFEKLKTEIRKAELDLTFLTNCQTFNVYSKFLTINLPSVTSYDARFTRTFIQLTVYYAAEARK